ncbi:MAG: glycosyltransferase [Bacteroidales bacterium]|nr:glycosyltransferase [Bacteroidales bacterium]
MIRFAIITVTYNAADCIERTVQSVLAQDYPAVDYLVVDGGSKDDTPAIISHYADRLTWWCSEPDRGIYDGMNKGIEQVYALSRKDGEERYVLMLNADDTFYSRTTLSEVAAYIAQQQDRPDVVAGSWMLHPEHGAYLNHPGDLSRLPHRYVLCHQATFVRSSVLHDNLFDLRYRLAGDFAQLSSLYLKGYRFAVCADIVICNMMLNVGATERHWRESVHEAFDVVRANGCYRWGAETWLLCRKGVVRLIKRLLPQSLSNALFAWLARHYKTM